MRILAAVLIGGSLSLGALVQPAAALTAPDPGPAFAHQADPGIAQVYWHRHGWHRYYHRRCRWWHHRCHYY